MRKWQAETRFHSNEIVIEKINTYFARLGQSHESEGRNKVEQCWTKFISLRGYFNEKLKKGRGLRIPLIDESSRHLYRKFCVFRFMCEQHLVRSVFVEPQIAATPCLDRSINNTAAFFSNEVMETLIGTLRSTALLIDLDSRNREVPLRH